MSWLFCVVIDLLAQPIKNHEFSSTEVSVYFVSLSVIKVL